MLDDDLLARRRFVYRAASQQACPISPAIQADIDVAVAGHFHRRHARNRADLLHQLLCDFARRLPQLFGKRESRRHGHLAEATLPRLLHGDRQIYAITDLDVGAEGARNLFFNSMKHGKLRV